MTEKSARVALVTGGSGGIGRAICRALADNGCRVAVGDLSLDASTEVAEGIGGLPLELDVTDEGSVASSVEETRTWGGSVDVLVNCAGWDQLMPFVETDEAFSSRVIDINLAGPIRMCRAVVPGMIDQEWGRIVNIASDAGRVGSSMEAVYSGAKGGLISFTKTLAREVARRGVTANSVCPGPTDTPLLRSIIEATTDAERTIQNMVRAVPMRRLGTPEEFAPAVAFFASHEAGYVTGQTLSVSGGLTMA